MNYRNRVFIIGAALEFTGGSSIDQLVALTGLPYNTIKRTLLKLGEIRAVGKVSALWTLQNREILENTCHFAKNGRCHFAKNGRLGDPGKPLKTQAVQKVGKTKMAGATFEKMAGAILDKKGVLLDPAAMFYDPAASRPKYKICATKVTGIQIVDIVGETGPVGACGRLFFLAAAPPVFKESFKKKWNISFFYFSTLNVLSKGLGREKLTIGKKYKNLPREVKKNFLKLFTKVYVKDLKLFVNQNPEYVDEFCIKLAVYMYDKIIEKNPTNKTVLNAKASVWLGDLLSIKYTDNRPWREIYEVFEFASNDTFWWSVLGSPSGLRKHYDKINTKRLTQGGKEGFVYKKKEYM